MYSTSTVPYLVLVPGTVPVLRSEHDDVGGKHAMGHSESVKMTLQG